MKQLGKSITWIHWYKQSAGGTLNLIFMHQKSINPSFEPGFPASRFSASSDEKMSNLTILRTVERDEGIYHCAHMDWTKSTWYGTYLSIKGNSKRTSNYTVVQRSTESDPARPADSETLQCSVLSDSEDETCSEDLRVFWFRARSDNSLPDIIYSDGNRPGNCSKKSGTQRRCSYEFSKNIGSSDDGTFYCAVATCGQILFGQGTKFERDKASHQSHWSQMIIIICFAISVIINVVFICHHIQKSSCKQPKESSSSQARQNNFSQQENFTEYEQDLSYAALHFSGGKPQRGTKKRELKTEESLYSHVKE
ncbi:uncharacterized protein LOC108243982 [Kryptolebias marmoratus]|uniref:uncharacterized protein LOC108243982 n=1 Tax=Kryptolebias marmoratus TaxID=37003 RepID=UPI0018ACD6A6|nr:uncharacterized protein LOC108243982 [Kryptolebias marmoratus]